MYASTFTKEEETPEGEREEVEVPFLKSYAVFNLEQIDGLPERYYDKPAEPLNPVERIEHAEEFFEATGAEVQHRGTQTLYRAITYLRYPA